MPSSPPMDPDAYQKTQAQLEAIEQDIKASQPLTSSLEDVLPALTPYYKNESGVETSKYFLWGIDELSTKYEKIRKTRGDGNCYYRSFLFSLCESLLTHPSEKARVISYVKNSMQFVTSVGGYEEMAIEVFYDSLVEFLEGLSTVASLHEDLTQENSTSDYCTWYLRILTATFLKSDPTRFIPYLEDGYVDIATFCQREIEPMGKECTMVQVLALAEAFQVKVFIEYLDGREFKPIAQDGNGITQHSFGPDSAETTLYLLYRPGHYDIIYPK